MAEYFFYNGVEYRRTYVAGSHLGVDEIVTPDIAATPDYIANHVASEAIPLATQDATIISQLGSL